MTTDSAEPVVQARDLRVCLSARAGATTLVDGLDLTVRPGTSVAITGRSGSGKTTLLSVLGLMHPPARGSLEVAGHAVAGLSSSRAARLRNSVLGFVFQNYSLVEHLSVAENVALPLSYGARTTRAMTRTLVGRQLDAVGLNGFDRRRPRSLSGGEQQRVAIARALVRGPRLVLADEPTGALDVATGEEVFAHLRSATVGAGAALVVVTHDPLLAASLDHQVHLGGRRPVAVI